MRCVEPAAAGAYLGRGSGAEPAGRWRREACCPRAPRGWGCCGHFHCLQTGAQGQPTGTGKQSRVSQARWLVQPAPPAGDTPHPPPREGLWRGTFQTRPRDLVIQPEVNPASGPWQSRSVLRAESWLGLRHWACCWHGPRTLGCPPRPLCAPGDVQTHQPEACLPACAPGPSAGGYRH